MFTFMRTFITKIHPESVHVCMVWRQMFNLFVANILNDGRPFSSMRSDFHSF